MKRSIEMKTERSIRTNTNTNHLSLDGSKVYMEHGRLSLQREEARANGRNRLMTKEKGEIEIRKGEGK